MQFDILTIFPDLIYSYCDDSILGLAQKRELIKIAAHNFREFAIDKHRQVDDTQYGGGAGMVLKVEPIYYCLEAIGALSGRFLSLRGAKRRSNLKTTKEIAALPAVARNDKTKVIILDPAGKKFDQKMAQKFSKLDRLVLISGRYQGFDERVYKFVDEKVSVGDFVLSGGELPALSIVEATARLIRGVLGNAESLAGETLSVIPAKAGIQSATKQRLDSRLRGNDKLIEPPLYTRPDNFLGLKVPKILLSGDHKKIKEWREGKIK